MLHVTDHLYHGLPS